MSEIDFSKLQAPIPKNQVKTKKVTWTDKKTGEMKSYSANFITARTVMNRLDEVCGPANWKAEFSNEGLPPKSIRCILSLRIDGEWVGKEDVGTMTDIEPEKGMISDAIKRAAVHWGIGRELYREGTADLDDDASAGGQETDQNRTARPQARKSAPKRRDSKPARTPAPSNGNGATGSDLFTYDRWSEARDYMIKHGIVENEYEAFGRLLKIAGLPEDETSPGPAINAKNWTKQELIDKFKARKAEKAAQNS